jgi:glycerol-3-phosphate dehydrogenase (NAD(P)+)
MIGILGAGAFGTALAVALAKGGRDVRLWARSAEDATRMKMTRRNDERLPGIVLPQPVSVHADLADLQAADVLLLCMPMQSLAGFLVAHPGLAPGRPMVACCKGVDLESLRGPVSVIEAAEPGRLSAMLTGPSFAADIAKGLPTALTLACRDDAGVGLQADLSTSTLRIYRTDDITGAELGGALKNVVAIAAGAVIGAGLGDSARAALMTRGYAEMVRLAVRLGARPETLAGLSGFGDLVLTCTSPQSRNFRFGEALGKRLAFDPNITVEGVATATAVVRLARQMNIDMPVTELVDALVSGRVALEDAMPTLMNRPLKQE